MNKYTKYEYPKGTWNVYTSTSALIGVIHRCRDNSGIIFFRAVIIDGNSSRIRSDLWPSLDMAQNWIVEVYESKL